MVKKTAKKTKKVSEEPVVMVEPKFKKSSELPPKEPCPELPKEVGQYVLWNTYGWLLIYHTYSTSNNVTVTRHFHGMQIDDAIVTLEEAKKHWATQLEVGGFMNAGKMFPVK